MRKRMITSRRQMESASSIFARYAEQSLRFFRKNPLFQELHSKASTEAAKET